jgi:hypothetical protein
MTDRRRELLARLADLEKAAAPGSGWLIFACLAQLASLSDRLVPCVACEVTDRNGERLRVDRLRGESLEQLHARSNPSGSWRARPVPVMAEPEPLPDGVPWRLGG